jgi:acetolactate synthase-1/2/3 large subunit
MARAADILVETLKLHRVDRVFCVPGESYLAVIDAMYDAPEIDVVTTRHEGGAGFMAVADAKMTGRPGLYWYPCRSARRCTGCDVCWSSSAGRLGS